MTTPVELRRWLDPALLAAAGLACAAGFAQFGVTAALGDIATAFGEDTPADGVAAQVGMTGTTLGLGLAIIRLASLGSLPAAGLADHYGRRRTVLACLAGGLALTVASGFAPTFWWFVALFALGRPLLAGTNAVAGVIAAEETSSVDRSKAVALVGAAYAVGTGLLTIVRGVAADWLGFRGIFFLAAVPLVLLPLLARWVPEPARYRTARPQPSTRRFLGPLCADLRPRLYAVCAIHFGVGLLTGPVNSYVFAYGEGVLGLVPAAMSAIFVVSGTAGLAGLLLGRWAADRLGRRVTAGGAMVAAAAAGFAAYTGTVPALALGFFVSTFAASTFTPAAGALDAEVFPTDVRSTAAGWVSAAQVLGAVVGLAVFGVVADATGSFAPAAAAVTAPAAALSACYAFLPETRGKELEDVT